MLVIHRTRTCTLPDHSALRSDTLRLHVASLIFFDLYYSPNASRPWMRRSPAKHPSAHGATAAPTMSIVNLLALPSDVLDPVFTRVNGATKVQLAATCGVLGQRFADPQVCSAAVRNADQVTVACKHSNSEEP